LFNSKVNGRKLGFNTPLTVKDIHYFNIKKFEKAFKSQIVFFCTIILYECRKL